MSDVSCLANCTCSIDRNRLAKIKTYTVPKSEIAAEPIVTAPMWFVPVTYHTITHTGRVAVAKYDEPIKFRWIEGTRAAQPERVKVAVG